MGADKGIFSRPLFSPLLSSPLLPSPLLSPELLYFLLLSISDHYLVSVLNFKAPKPLPTYVISRSYKNYDSESFVNDLAQVPWYENALIDDAGEKVEHFNEKFLEVLERHAPVRKRKVRNRQFPFLLRSCKTSRS